MKIIYVAVFDDEGVSSDPSKSRAMEKLGHLVIPYNYRVRAAALGSHNRDNEIINLTRLEKPDLIIFAKANTVNVRVFQECKKICSVCYWFADPLVTYRNLEFYEKTTACSFFICDKENVLEEAKNYNSSCFIVSDGYDSDIERPKEVDNKYDVGFIGNLYGKRKEKIEEINRKVDIISDAYGERHSEAVGEIKINLNFCTTEGASDRVFKTLAAKGFLLTDDWLGREKMFEDGKHLVIFKDAEDLNEKIEYYLKNEKERDKIRRAGHQEIQKYTRHKWAENTLNIFKNFFKSSVSAEKDIKTTLLAGPWVGEFGWELFAWQAYVRRLSLNYDRTIVISRPLTEDLYSDFADEFVPYDPPGTNADAFFMHGLGNIDLVDIYPSCEKLDKSRLSWIKPQKIGSPPYTYFKEKCIIEGREVEPLYFKYGEKTDDKKYDIVLHARNRQLRKEDNWDISEWNSLIAKLKASNEQIKIAAIGTQTEAALPEGCDDYRNKPLSEVFDILASSRVCIGPSSGPLHLATLCGCPQLVWSIETNSLRYLHTWNPFDTPVYFTSKFNWQPPVEYIFNKLSNLLPMQQLRNRR